MQSAAPLPPHSAAAPGPPPFSRTLPPPPSPLRSGAFRINRLYAITNSGKDVSGCDGPAFKAADVPQRLQAELGCVWNSYAEPNNNEELWATVWREDKEGGRCAGLAQDDWMRLALELRQKHNPDVRWMRAWQGGARGSRAPGACELDWVQAAKLGNEPGGPPDALLSPTRCRRLQAALSGKLQPLTDGGAIADAIEQAFGARAVVSCDKR